MKRVILLAALMAAASLTACQSTTPTTARSAAKAGDPVEQKLQELAGSGATNCGRIKSQDPAQLKPASDCAMQASQQKKPFYVAYEMPGLTVAIAGNSEGKLFSVSSEQPESAQPGAQAEAKSAPCPAELRVAQSGRLTCMTAGASGMGMGGASPHGGMPMPSTPAGGENPHAGAMGTKPGTANPHATPKPPEKKP